MAAEEEHSCNSPAAMMAIWLDNLGQVDKRDQEKMLLTVDFDREYKLKHILVCDTAGGEHWSKHFRRNK